MMAGRGAGRIVCAAASAAGRAAAAMPVLAKELRVAGRRRRSYALRVAYVALLAVFVAVVWARHVRLEAAGAGIYRMPDAGKRVATEVLWFQFFALQVAAAAVMATSVGEEVRGHALAALVATPIGGFGIVAGKLLGGMFQLLVLAALSVPVLAVVRVLGGVPWAYVVACACVSLAAGLLAGAIALYVSMRLSEAYQAVTLAVALAAGFQLAMHLLPWTGGAAAAAGLVDERVARWHLVCASAWEAMHLAARRITIPGAEPDVPPAFWVVNCLVTLGFAALLLAVAAGEVRRLAAGEAKAAPAPQPAWRAFRVASAAAAALGDTGRSGAEADGAPSAWRWPVAWKDLHGCRLRWLHWWWLLAMAAYILLLPLPLGDGLRFTRTAVQVLLVVGAASLGVRSALSVPAEKEGRTWEALLSAGLGDGRIVLEKAAAALGRSASAWVLLAGVLIVATAVRAFRPVLLVRGTLLAASAAVFVLGVGLYCGVRFRRSTTAVAATFGVCGLLWGLLPYAASGMAQAHRPTGWAAGAATISPWRQAEIVLAAAAYEADARYLRARPAGRAATDAADGGPAGPGMYTCAACHVLAGLLLLWRAKCRLRRNVF